MNPLILQALKFAGPALRLLFSQMTLNATQSWLANVVLKLIDQATSVATSGGHAFGVSASAAAGVPLPPEHEWTEEGIERWVESQAGPDDAA